MGGDQNGFVILDCLSPGDQKSAGNRHRSLRPAKARKMPAVNPDEKTAHRRQRARRRAGEEHDRRQRAAVNGGTFHQSADGLQIFSSPVRIPWHYFASQSQSWQAQIVLKRHSSSPSSSKITSLNRGRGRNEEEQAGLLSWLFRRCFSRLKRRQIHSAVGFGENVRPPARARAMARRGPHAARNRAGRARAPGRRRAAAA